MSHDLTSPETSDNNTIGEDGLTDAQRKSLIVQLNRFVAGYYPEGCVDYPEAVKSLFGCCMSYLDMLRKLDNNAHDLIISDMGAMLGRRIFEAQKARSATPAGDRPEARTKFIIDPNVRRPRSDRH